MSRSSFKYLVFAAPFLLAACGEGYEMVRTTDYLPYGNKRTAGSAIAYVQANMMPARELNLKPVSREQKPKVVEPEAKSIEDTKEILKDLESDMDKLFEDAQRK